MKNFFLKHWLKIAGITVGALAGYLYYYYVGCVSGTCPITSNPYRMLIYGGITWIPSLRHVFTKKQSKESN